MNPTASSIRRARDSDIPALLELENTCFDTYYRDHRFDEADFRYYLRDPRTIAHVAVTRGDLVAYSLGVQHTGRLSHLARIHSLAVHPKAQRHGLGRRLLSSFVRAATKRGCSSVLLEVAKRNEAGAELFRKAGFHETKDLPGYYGRGIDGVRMRLDMKE